MLKNISIQNKKARFEYEILDQFEAGLVLYGTEIKSIRNSKASISESFCQLKDGELWVINMSIEEYKFGSFYNHKLKRERKLLLHKREIEKLERRTKDVGYTIVPLKLFLNEKGKAKLIIALARGKKNFDKRQDIKLREDKINISRLLRSR